jgi:hypothetical protein
MKMKILRNALWVGFSLTELNQREIGKLLPDFLQLAPVSPLAGMTPEPMLLFNAYRVQSRWMNGVRLDVQTFAVDSVTGTHHLVILDVMTDTPQWDPKNGLAPPNAVSSFDRSGRQVELSDATSGETLFAFNANSSPGVESAIDFSFCVEANRKCFFSDCPIAFRMHFDEEEVMHNVDKIQHFKVAQSACRRLQLSEVGPPRIAFLHPQPMLFDVDLLNTLFT